MQNNVIRKIGVILIFVIAVASLFLIDLRPKTVIYNCSISEISPDFPPKVREECRRLRAKHLIQT